MLILRLLLLLFERTKLISIFKKIIYIISYIHKYSAFLFAIPTNKLFGSSLQLQNENLKFLYFSCRYLTLSLYTPPHHSFFKTLLKLSFVAIFCLAVGFHLVISIFISYQVSIFRLLVCHSITSFLDSGTYLNDNHIKLVVEGRKCKKE